MPGINEAKQVLNQLNSVPGAPEWVLLELDEATGKALVLSRECVARMPFHAEWTKITWEECTLRQWLNTEFYDSLPEAVRARVVETELKNPDACTIPGGNDTVDKVFLLGVDHYNAMDASLRAAEYRGSGCWWWLRTPGYDSYNFANVNRCGGLDGGFDPEGKYSGHGYHVDSDSGCVRPACYLNLNP